MPQTNYTPILIYASSTTGNTPAAGNLTNSAGGAELAINYFDGRLFYKDASNVVQVLATKGTGTIGGSNTQVQFNSSGALAGSSNMTFNGTTLSVNGLTVTNNPTFNGGTANGVLYLDGSKVVTSGTALTFNGTNLSLTAAGGAYFYTPNVVNGGGIFDAGGNNGMLIFGNVGGSTLRFLASGAEQMRLNSTGLGIGTNNPGTKLDVQGVIPFIRLKENTTGYLGVRGENASGNFYFGIDNAAGSFYGSAYGRVLYADGAFPMVFYTNATERMRLDASGNLTLNSGTGSGLPTAQTGLNVFGGASVSATTSPGVVTLGANSNSIASGQVIGRLQFYSNDASTSMFGSVAKIDCLATSNFATEAQTALTFHTNTGAAGTLAEVMRLDASGNLGLGVTPSANWKTGGKAFQVSTYGSLFSSTSGDTSVINNAYLNLTASAWVYLNTAPATRYDQYLGAHFWYTAPSGTAGNAISFTQAMTLDASGNLGIGLTNQTFRLEVSNASAVPARFNRNQAGQAIGALIFNQPNTTDGNSLTLRYTSDTTGAGAATDVPFAEIEFAADIHNQATRAGSIRFLTSLGGVGNSQERMRLDANGNLGIGTTNPGTKLDVNGSVRTGSDGSNVGLYLGASSIRQAATGGLFIDANSTGAAGGIFFRDSSSFTTRMQIDASGNLGLGVTPSATQAAHRSIELFGSLWMGGNSVTPASYFYTNAYFDGADRYKTSGFAASLYRQVSGAHAWLTAPSGTAGNVVSFTQAMTLDASGRLLLGTTSATGASMDIQGSASGVVELLNIQNTSTNAAAISRLTIGSQGGNWRIDNERTGAPLKFSLGASLYFTLDGSGNVVTGNAAIATNATNGFLYVPTCAGTPTGTPTTYTGRSPIVVDSTNNKLYFYSGGAWRDAGP